MPRAAEAERKAGEALAATGDLAYAFSRLSNATPERMRRSCSDAAPTCSAPETVGDLGKCQRIRSHLIQTVRPTKSRCRTMPAGARSLDFRRKQRRNSGSQRISAWVPFRHQMQNAELGGGRGRSHRADKKRLAGKGEA